MVEVTFLWAEMAGADPTAHVPQLFAVIFILSVLPDVPSPDVLPVWQDEHAIMAALTPA